MHPSAARLIGDEMQQTLRLDPHTDPPDRWGHCGNQAHVELIDMGSGRRWQRAHVDPYCDDCPTMEECLLYALASRDEDARMHLWLCLAAYQGLRAVEVAGLSLLTFAMSQSTTRPWWCEQARAASTALLR